MKCWICNQNIEDDYMMLPYKDDFLEQKNISLSKNTFIIKNIDKFQFLYYTCCYICIDNYLKYYGRFFQMLKMRELGRSKL